MSTVEYATIEEGAAFGNLPAKLEVLKRMARADAPIHRLLARADELAMSDVELANLIAAECGDQIADIQSDVNYARWCATNGHTCSI